MLLQEDTLDPAPGPGKPVQARTPEVQVVGLRAAGRVDDDGVLLAKIAAQQRLGQARLQLALHRALHGARAVHRVVPLGLRGPARGDYTMCLRDRSWS